MLGQTLCKLNFYFSFQGDRPITYPWYHSEFWFKKKQKKFVTSVSKEMIQCSDQRFDRCIMQIDNRNIESFKRIGQELQLKYYRERFNTQTEI